MTSDDPVDRLIASGVFELTGTDELRLTEAFRQRTADYRSMLADDETDGIEGTIADLTDDTEVATALCDATRSDPELIARYVCLHEHDSELRPAQALTLAVIVGQVENSRPPSEGAPEAFLPVDGDELVQLVGLYERCVVFAWREDCPPCDTVKADFDAIYGDSPPEDVMFLAVYGPECPELLEAEFDVVGAPTTLFTLSGSVDARLVGAPSRETLEGEVETIRSRTLPST